MEQALIVANVGIQQNAATANYSLSKAQKKDLILQLINNNSYLNYEKI